MQTVATDALRTDSIIVTHVAEAPEMFRLEPGTERRWDHHETDHHITVVTGTCRVLGRRIEAGGFAYVPAGVDHAVTAGAWGCSFFSVDSATRAV